MGLTETRAKAEGLPTAGGSVAQVMPLRVVVAEDQLLLREGLSRLLTDSGCEVVAQARDAVDLRRKVAAHRPDVAIIDVQMPPDQTDDGLRAAIQIRRAHPETGVLMLSQFRDEAYALDLIGENARGVGYLLKDRGRRRGVVHRRSPPGRDWWFGAGSRDRRAAGRPASPARPVSGADAT
jgi:CheY-like chemotaxis protein